MSRSHHPASGHGWQATPGQPIPRAARQPSANGLLLVILALVWFSPLSIVAWLAGQAVILLQRRWHWWRFALAAQLQRIRPRHPIQVHPLPEVPGTSYPRSTATGGVL